MEIKKNTMSVEMFANVKRFGFETFIRACQFLNETKTITKFKYIPLLLVAFCFKLTEVVFFRFSHIVRFI